MLESNKLEYMDMGSLKILSLSVAEVYTLSKIHKKIEKLYESYIQLKECKRRVV